MNLIKTFNVNAGGFLTLFIWQTVLFSTLKYYINLNKVIIGELLFCILGNLYFLYSLKDLFLVNILNQSRPPLII